MRETIADLRLDEERALYHLQHAEVTGCVFAGPADGESALKETRDIRVLRSLFSLRYPLWHAQGFFLDDCVLDESARAPIWYSREGSVANTRIRAVKAVRECSGVRISGSEIASDEFGWKSDGITLERSSIESAYLFLDSRNIRMSDVRMRGKYSFQYTQDVEIRDCELDTKDAFWHSKNVTVRSCVVTGEYLGWFSDGLTLINCKITGTQPLCYCSNLKLIGCTMERCDLAFEYSDVQADVIGHIESVKNPKSGRITADSVGEIITDAPVMDCTGEVVLRGR